MAAIITVKVGGQSLTVDIQPQGGGSSVDVFEDDLETPISLPADISRDTDFYVLTEGVLNVIVTQPDGDTLFDSDVQAISTQPAVVMPVPTQGQDILDVSQLAARVSAVEDTQGGYGFGDIVTHDADEFETAGAAAAAISALNLGDVITHDADEFQAAFAGIPVQLVSNDAAGIITALTALGLVTAAGG